MDIWYFVIGPGTPGVVAGVNGGRLSFQPGGLKIALASAEEQGALLRDIDVADDLTLPLSAREMPVALVTGVIDMIATTSAELFADVVAADTGFATDFGYLVWDGRTAEVQSFVPAGSAPGINLDVDPDVGPWRMLAAEDAGYDTIGAAAMSGARIGVTPGPMQAAVARLLEVDLSGFPAELVEQASLRALVRALEAGEIDIAAVPAEAAAPGFLPAGLIALQGPLVTAAPDEPDIPPDPTPPDPTPPDPTPPDPTPPDPTPPDPTPPDEPDPGGTADLGGRVLGRDGVPLEGVRVVFTPSGAAAPTDTATGADGRFGFTLPAGQEGRIEAVLDYAPGGRDAGAITTADALAVLRLAVGLPAAPGRETTAADLIAADVRGTGEVTTADALEVLRLAVGLPTEAAPRYVFLDAATAAAPGTGPLPDPDAAPTVLAGGEPLQLVAILVGDLV